MPAINRLDEMVALVLKRGFMSVRELSELFGVSEVTIRRDLQRLHDEQRLLRTYGGAAPLSPQPARQPRSAVTGLEGAPASSDSSLIEQVDALIAISWSPRSDAILLERAAKHAVPIVAESLAMPGARTLIAGDNHEAGRSLGRWAGPESLGSGRVDRRSGPVVLGAVRCGPGHGPQRTAVGRAGGIDDSQVIAPDHTVQMCIDEVQSRRSTPVAEQAGLDVCQPQGFAQQGIGKQIDLARRKIVGSPPPAVDQADFAF